MYPSPGMILQVGGWLSINWFSIRSSIPTAKFELIIGYVELYGNLLGHLPNATLPQGNKALLRDYFEIMVVDNLECVVCVTKKLLSEIKNAVAT